MNRPVASIFVAFLFLATLLRACAPASIPNPPTSTSLPTNTPSPVLPTVTANQIPGIGTPITINDVGLQVKSATLGSKPPTTFTTQPGYILLSIEIALSGGNDFKEVWNKVDAKEFLVVDENGNQSGMGFFDVSLSSLNSGSSTFNVILEFGVKNDAHTFSLHFPNGQNVDLTSVLSNK